MLQTKNFELQVQVQQEREVIKKAEHRLQKSFELQSSHMGQLHSNKVTSRDDSMSSTPMRWKSSKSSKAMVFNLAHEIPYKADSDAVIDIDHELLFESRPIHESLSSSVANIKAMSSLKYPSSYSQPNNDASDSGPTYNRLNNLYEKVTSKNHKRSKDC